MESSTTAHAGASSATETRTAPNPARLKMAIDQMAARYGLTCMDQACALPGTVEHATAMRAASRQYRALMRLTHALAELAVGGAR